MRTFRKTSGQTLVEFVLVLPLLLVLVMGLFETGRAVFYFSVLNTAVREGTRYAIVQPYCDYKLDPDACDGEDLDLYPLDCNEAASIANINICNEITKNYYNIGELSSSTITIDHTINSTDDPVINISIDFLFKPITPGLALMGELPLQVNSQMLVVPIGIP